MRAKRVVRVKADTEDARTLVEGDGLTADKDLGVEIGLTSFVRGKQRYRSLIRRYTEELTLGPCDDSVEVILKAALQLSNFDGRVTEREVICV